MDNERLIYKVEKRHVLHDAQHSFYKGMLAKDKVWKEIVQLLGVKVNKLAEKNVYWADNAILI